MITSISLKFGRAVEAPPTSLTVTPVTVFVGPNNSGKSRILRELQRFCRTGQKDANDLLLDDITFKGLTEWEALASIQKIIQPAQQGEAQSVDSIFVGSRYARLQVPLSGIMAYVQNPMAHLHAFCSWYLTHYTLLLDGKSRINLINQQDTGDLQRPPVTSFQLLFKDDDKRKEVRRIILEATGRHFVLDPTGMTHLRIRLAGRPPLNDFEERGIHAEAISFHASAQPIDDASDGIKAFTGIVTELIAGDPRIILIDEPEAFLHPSLAFKLGQEIAKAALSADKRVFASTHSAQFVMGCIQSGAPVSITRLTYRDGAATARVLPSQEILELMRHPLLRSTGLLNGLFYEFVVVSESDADRAFYQEINERLLQFKPEFGIPSCLFLNAQNKQTIQTLIGPLRKLGIPAAAITDIDVVKDGGQNWTNLLNSAGVPQISQGPLSSHRAAVKSAFEVSGKNMKVDGGLAILDLEERQSARDLMNQLNNYGIFVVPSGEPSLGSRSSRYLGMGLIGLLRFLKKWARTRWIVLISNRLKEMYGTLLAK